MFLLRVVLLLSILAHGLPPAAGPAGTPANHRMDHLRTVIDKMPEAALRRLLLDAGLRDTATHRSILEAPATRRAEPSAGSGYPSEGNFLCTRSYGKGSFPLPCKPAREHWDWAFRERFGIAAWWGPSLHITNGSADLSEVQHYRDAHFSILDGGPSLACSGDPNATAPIGSPDQAFDCLARILKQLRALGLKLTLGWGDDISKTKYPPYRSAANVLGGVAGMGGVTDSGPGSWSITTPEVAWLVGELEKRNLTDGVAQIFFHDDEIGDSAATTNSVKWLRENANHIAPQTNTFSDSAPESLYTSGEFIFSPVSAAAPCASSFRSLKQAAAQEQYAVRGNGQDAAKMTDEQLTMYANDQLLSERYRLDLWPLFALGDGGSVVDTRSDSLVRVQVFSALAYGARGVIYYCWHDGVWNSTATDANFRPLSNYNVAKRTNADGKIVILSRFACCPSR